MRTIHKYPLAMDVQGFTPVYEQILEMPKSAKILAVKNQYERPTLWAMVDPADKETRRVQVYCVGTGQTITFPFASVRFLDTVLTSNGQLVWHIFVKD